MGTRFSRVLAVLLVPLFVLACDEQSQTSMTAPGGDIASSTTKSNFEDSDNNGFPDEGETVTGSYSAYLAFEGNFFGAGDWYWDLGDGRILGTVSDPSQLDSSILTECDYKIQYRGNFENDPFMDSGWIQNEISCNGFTGTSTRNLTIIHETDPRYTGERIPEFGGEWEYLRDARSGQGNVVNPRNPN